MKLLFDQNLSHRLVEVLSQEFSGSVHVRTVGLEAASDQAVWEFARTGGYVILSKDSDFHQMSFLFGAPPKVVWIRKGNCSTDAIAEILRSRQHDLQSFLTYPEASFLILG